MFPSALLELTAKILRETFPNGCKIATWSNDLNVVRQRLEAETRQKIQLDRKELARLVRAAGTLVDGLVYPFRSHAAHSEARSKTVARESSPNFTIVPRAQIPKGTLQEIAKVLYRQFPEGFDVASAADLQRFRAEAPAFQKKSDAETLGFIAGVGNLISGKVYLILKAGQDFLKETVESLFNDGVGLIFYQTFFEYHRETLLKHRFVTVEAMENRLRAYFRNFVFHDEYFEPAATPGALRSKIKSEINRAWGRNASLQLQTLVDRLWIPPEKVVDVLERYPDEYRPCGSRYARFAPSSCEPVRTSAPRFSVAPSPKTSEKTLDANRENNVFSRIASPNRSDVASHRLFPTAPRATLQRLKEKLQNAGVQGLKIDSVAQREELKEARWAVATPNNVFVHRDCYVDLDEAAETFYEILERLFAKFNGCVDAENFFNAVKIDLPMFLNDNDLRDYKQVFALARHLFVVERFRQTDYEFANSKFIYREKSSEERGGYYGVLIAKIKELGGRATRAYCAEFLTKLNASSPTNVNSWLKIAENRDVFLNKPDAAEEAEYVLAETLEIDDAWLRKIAAALALVLNEKSPFVVLRDLNDAWFARLPSLPFGFEWNRLLLQEIVEKKMKEYRFISAFKNQRLDSIKAGLTLADSLIQTFPDLVHAFLTLRENDVWGRRIEEKELREILVGAGLLASNELANPGSVASALDDRRFAWKNNAVLILQQ